LTRFTTKWYLLFVLIEGDPLMKVSTRGRYGLRVMIELAAQYGNGPVLVDGIAKNQEISGKYIHVIVSGLRSAGLVRSVRGPNGGYELTRSPSRITALDVISALEGKSAPAARARGTALRATCGAKLPPWWMSFYRLLPWSNSQKGSSPITKSPRPITFKECKPTLHS
jgi:Rrf2 family protein